MHSQDDRFPENLLASVEKIAKKEGYRHHKVDTKLIPAEGASFCGKLFSVTIKGETDEGKKENNIFVKYRVPGAKVEEALDLAGVYAAEAYIYNELFSIFSELQDEAGIPTENRFHTVKSYDVSNDEALMLENMTLKGYKSCHRTYLASLQVAKLSIAEIAKFHALIFVIKEKRPKYFEEKIKSFEPMFIINDEWDRGGLNVARISAKHVKGEAKEKLDKFIDEKFLDKWKKYVTTCGAKGNLCHGDFRLNNVLMKFKNDEVTDVITVDYQLMHYGCPVEDFLFFIFTGTDRDFRTRHLEYLKEFYYQTLSGFLKNFVLDPESIYSKKEFEDDYKYMLDYGLICSLFFCPLFLAAEGETPDVGVQLAGDMDFKVHDSFPERMQGIVDDFVSWGHL